MNAVHGLGALVLALVSGGVGWMLHAPEAPPPAPATAAAEAAEAAEAPSSRLSVLAWPQPAEEPARAEQAGCAGKDAATTAAAPVQPPRDDTPAERLARALRGGSEQQRYDALLQARSEGEPLPEAQLMQLMAQDPSERVRLLAFDNYIEAQSGDLDALRSGLQAVLRIPHTALQAKAREQLDGIEQLYQHNAALGQQQYQQ
ncbi:hypothetical protein [uncultured Azohydromonas sp.]|uniref:hypothetical protein n=1 Tax=uncultured Azohydromonas sp. TaxID=487342 RepID=UPI0026361FD0|nr:hypothetical protein [uncultured Azohydromonas sp.]